MKFWSTRLLTKQTRELFPGESTVTVAHAGIMGAPEVIASIDKAHER